MIDAKKAALYRYSLTAVILGCGAMSACFLASSPAPDKKVKPEEWRESRGPVVPHDTFPSDCTLCHAKGSWHEIRKDFVYDHEKETGTPLHGAHAQAQCLRCHNDRGAVAQFSKRGCAGCHEDIHRGRLGGQCTSCHSENNWNPTGIYAAHARTRFPLTGSHIGVACFRCHPAAESGQFLGADPRCEACHRNEALQAKVSANGQTHTDLNLLTGCQQCHTPTSWQNATFNHANIVAGTCINCHLAQATLANNANTNHAAFGTNCTTCHTTRSWSFFHRTSFPMNHRGVNGVCAKCHFDLTTPRMFDCIICHEGTSSVNKAKVDQIHLGKVRGYTYGNDACYRCHPTGRGGD